MDNGGKRIRSQGQSCAKICGDGQSTAIEGLLQSAFAEGGSNSSEPSRMFMAPALSTPVAAPMAAPVPAPMPAPVLAPTEVSASMVLGQPAGQLAGPLKLAGFDTKCRCSGNCTRSCPARTFGKSCAVLTGEGHNFCLQCECIIHSCLVHAIAAVCASHILPDLSQTQSCRRLLLCLQFC